MKAARQSVELQHSKALAAWAQLQAVTVPELNHLFHWPNGGARDRKTVIRKGKAVTYSPAGVMLKAMGAKPGPLDYWLFVPRRGFAGMAFEMKASLAEKMSKEQRDFAAQLVKCGFHVPDPFYDWESAARAITAYLALPVPSGYSTT